MDDSIAERLAANTRRLREARGLSQHQIAKLAEVPRPTWANLESGDANPTIQVLTKVARALNVRVEDLLAPARSAARLQPAETLPNVRRGKVSVRSLLMSPLSGLELERMVFAPHAQLIARAHAPSTYEYLTCEVGSLEVDLLGETYSLAAGDVLSFRADRPHTYRNSSAERAVAYAFVSLASDD
jgi:XRE family transcriptional regulator, regulator of sulfur utilization